MEPLLPVQVTPELRSAVTAMIERLSTWGRPELRAAAGWAPFAAALGLHDAASVDDGAPRERRVVVAVGPIATATSALGDAEAVGAVGFVAPSAVRRRWWQREPTVFLDPTMDVWASGWSPLALDRIDLAAADATIEVAVGHARPTPPRPSTTQSALDDPD